VVYSTPDFVLQIFDDAKQPGYQGVLELVSFLVVTGMLVGALVGSVMMLFAA
jgi:hypothetical protein